MLKCNHVPFLTKPDGFIACRLCDQIWWDSLDYEREGQAKPTGKPPTAKAIAKAASDGGARQKSLNLGLPTASRQNSSYYET